MKIKSSSLRNIIDVLIWLISLSLAWVFIQYGWSKFDPEGFWSRAFTKWGYGLYFMHFIGILEVGGAIAILIPRTASYGGFTLALVMLGALATRLIHGTSMEDVIGILGFMITALLIAFYWLKYFPFIRITND